MKLYQEQRARKENRDKPPIQQSTKNLHDPNDENKPPIVVPKVKGGKAPR